MKTILYGVLSVQRCWKLYAEGLDTLTFDTRERAVAAGENAARMAVANGNEVELYLQDYDGNFSKSRLAALAH